MSLSSGASKPLFAASNFSRAVTGFAASAEMRALNTALPIGFGGLVAALLAILFLEPNGWRIAPHPSFPLAAIAGAMLPAFGAMSCVTAIALAWQLALRRALPIVPQVLASAIAFALALPAWRAGLAPLAYLRSVGASGLLLAILVGMLCALLVRAAVRFLPAGRYLGAPLAVLPFVALHAAGIDLSAYVVAALAPLAHLGDTYPALLVIVFLETALWCIGIHGPALLAGVVTPVYLSLQAINAHAFVAHQPLPHIVVVSLFLFVFPGGAGATLPLAALLALSKVPRLRRIGRATLPFALINANEPLLFTLPIVANPFLALPFIGIPMLLASLTYAVVAAGWVARAAFYVPSSIPAPISVYLATLDWRAPILLLANLLVATALWLPAVRAYERHEVGLP